MRQRAVAPTDAAMAIALTLVAQVLDVELAMIVLLS
jgi:hypothetical protein